MGSKKDGTSKKGILGKLFGSKGDSDRELTAEEQKKRRKRILGSQGF